MNAVPDSEHAAPQENKPRAKRPVLRGKRLYVLCCAALLLLCIGFVIYRMRVSKVTWTAEKALLLAEAPSIEDDRDAESLLRAIDSSLTYYGRFPAEKSYRFGTELVTAGELIETLQDFRTKLEALGLTDSFYQYVGENYQFYHTAASKVLYTGYMIARLRGSLSQSAEYQYPIYRKEVGGLWEGILPGGKVAVLINSTLPDAVAIGQQHRIPFLIGDDGSGILAHHVGSIRKESDASKALSLHLRAKDIPGLVQALTRLIGQRADLRFNLKFESIGNTVQHQTRFGLQELLLRQLLAV